MTGKFIHDNKLIRSFKCVCHQENLAVNHMYKQFDELQKFNKKLSSIISHIQTSPKKIRILQNMQEEAEFDKAYNLLRAIEVLWNSFFFCYQP